MYEYSAQRQKLSENEVTLKLEISVNSFWDVCREKKIRNPLPSYFGRTKREMGCRRSVNFP